MEETAYRTFEGKLAFYHPTAAGKGCAVRFEIRPARRGYEGYVFAELAQQKTAAVRGGADSKAATFDWKSRVAVKLGLNDICAMLAVLEDRVASAGGDKGLFHQTADATTVIGFRRAEAPAAGYCLEVSRKARSGEAEPARMRLVLSEPEACGLRHVLGGAVFHLCFYGVTIRPATPA